MALDAILLSGIIAELRPKIIGARIDKVQQPARDQIVLLLRGNHEEEFLCYLELLLAVQEKRQLVIDESSSKDLENEF